MKNPTSMEYCTVDEDGNIDDALMHSEILGEDLLTPEQKKKYKLRWEAGAYVADDG